MDFVLYFVHTIIQKKIYVKRLHHEGFAVHRVLVLEPLQVNLFHRVFSKASQFGYLLVGKPILSYVQTHEQAFTQTANECSEQAMKKTMAQQHKELDKAQGRMSELNVLFRKLYEVNALGKLSDEQFAFLTSGYDEEKKTLTRRIAGLTQELATAAERSADVKRFVTLVRKYTAIEELTYENVHEFIDRILIHELDKETNTRKIEIFYSFVGRVDTGNKPTESISYFRQIGANVKSYAI